MDRNLISKAMFYVFMFFGANVPFLEKLCGWFALAETVKTPAEE